MFAQNSSFYKGTKIERVTLKCRHGNTIFIKMNPLQNGI